MENKKFRTSKNKQQAAGWTLLGGLVVGTLLFYKLIPGFADNILKYVLIALAIGVVLAIVAAIVVKEQYLQVLDDGFEVSKGKKTTKYPFKAFAGSKVTRHYRNGIYTGTTREIKIIKNDGKPDTINANRLSRDSFSELVSYLSKNEFKETCDIEVSADYFNQERLFNIPSESITKGCKGRLILWIIGTAVLALLAVGCLIGYFTNGSSFFLAAAIVMGIVAIIFAVINISKAAIDVQRTKNIPHHITCDAYTISIGSETLKPDVITSISMVPGSYDILPRELIVITKEGTKYKYFFGRNKNGDKSTYSDYDNLYTTIKLWCITKDVNFMSILG